jgi:hypothetical protein
MDSNVPLSRILSRAQQSCAQDECEGASTSACVQQLWVDDTPQSDGEMPCAESINPDMSFVDMLSEAQESTCATYCWCLISCGRCIVSDELYSHFLLLSVGIALLMEELAEMRNENLPRACQLLEAYSRGCQDIYGPAYIVYNIHSVQHLPHDV